ncbi:TPA: DUF1445 domain-containing protein [Candidatus Poribacteria bacterium]|nr:DUF1445 domain-containing protein [Candidatus Poribacteria bacterium]HIB89123.1 DUF1445 domain-containing protein [Candidatus Poribacteria bacterium]HIC02691.1 DUF1445 domain-containing protein [Candidatus Poribacteria bacterium]HIN27483.1 DUF1445 domain-containing protein [Candidatus Poribacteria bacterium]HIO09815.1 DUF1445 domain-containing protein [Candidatus Poribacteria bacterium]
MLNSKTTHYHTNIICQTQKPIPAGRFFGPVVITMRLMAPKQSIIACQLTRRFVYNHGAPLH